MVQCFFLIAISNHVVALTWCALLLVLVAMDTVYAVLYYDKDGNVGFGGGAGGESTNPVVIHWTTKSCSFTPPLGFAKSSGVVHSTKAIFRVVLKCQHRCCRLHAATLERYVVNTAPLHHPFAKQRVGPAKPVSGRPATVDMDRLVQPCLGGGRVKNHFEDPAVRRRVGDRLHHQRQMPHGVGTEACSLFGVQVSNSVGC